MLEFKVIKNLKPNKDLTSILMEIQFDIYYNRSIKLLTYSKIFRR